MKLRTLQDGTPLLEFKTYEWADFDALVLRLAQEFGCSRRIDPLNRRRSWLERDGMRLEAAPDGPNGFRIRALDPRAHDLLRVVVGAVLKEAEDRTRQALRVAARAEA